MTPAHILLVEDDMLILRTLARGLRDAGYQISEAESAEEAIRISARNRPDIAMLDIRMPGLSGLELAPWLVERDIPVLFLTAYDNPELVHAAKQAGALGYLVKPLDVPRIIPTLETALARARDLATLRKSEDKLVTAVKTNREISIAVGVLMERDGITSEQAFESLRSLARNQRKKITEVASEVLGQGS